MVDKDKIFRYVKEAVLKYGGGDIDIYQTDRAFLDEELQCHMIMSKHNGRERYPERYYGDRLAGYLLDYVDKDIGNTIYCNPIEERKFNEERNELVLYAQVVKRPSESLRNIAREE